MFAFSVFGRAHTQNIISYFKARVGGVRRKEGFWGEGGGIWKSLHSEQLLFLIMARVSLKQISPSNLAHAHMHEHSGFMAET